MMSASPDSKLENGEAGQSTMDTITIPKVPLQAPTTKPPEASSSKAGLPGKDATGKKIDSRTGSKTFKKSRFSRLDSNQASGKRNDKETIVLVLIFTLSVIFIPFTVIILKKRNIDIEADRKIRYDEVQQTLPFFNANGEIILIGYLATSLPRRPLPFYCTHLETTSEQICLKWNNLAILLIKYESNDNVKCFNVLWKSLKDGININFMDTFLSQNTNWYGLGEMLTQKWPLNIELNSPERVQTGNFKSNNIFGSIVDYYLLSSTGVAIYVSTERTLNFSTKIDDTTTSFSLSVQIDNRHYKDTHFNYSVCIGDNITAVHQYMIKRFFEKPVIIPPDDLFDFPIWITEPPYGYHTLPFEIQNLCEQIVARGFSPGYLIIGDNWNVNLGDFKFHYSFLYFEAITEKSIITHVKSLGFVQVSVTITPYFSIKSKNFQNWVQDKYFLPGPGNIVAGLKIMQEDIVALLDPTSRNSVEWFIQLIDTFRIENFIDAFVFLGGTVDDLPPVSQTDKNLYHLNHLSTAYIEMVTKIENVTKVTTGWRNQKYSPPITISLRKNNWSYTLGLRSIIPTILTLGILGYQFIIPDSVGGHCVSHNHKPNRDLYIRWLQLTSFLPFIQFCIPPWRYDDEVINITKEFMDLRTRVILPLIRDTFTEVLAYNYPIIRPIWWLNASDPNTFLLSDQFLIGNRTMIAPIVHSRKMARNIYFPRGYWYDELKKECFYHDGLWVKNYTTTYFKVAYFTYFGFNEC